MSALLENKLSITGIFKRDLPTHVARHTHDEKKLTEMLSRQGSVGVEERVQHDVDCVAGILTFRRGSTTDRIERAGHIFVSNSFMTVSTISKWYSSESGKGIPPAVNWLALSNIAWLKRPTAVPGLKLQQVIAVCGSVLKPSKDIWDCFLRHLREMVVNHDLSTEESVAIVANEFLDGQLLRIEEEECTDAETYIEVIERVKESLVDEYSRAREEERRRHEVELAAAKEDAILERRSREAMLAVARKRADAIAGGVSWSMVAIFGAGAILGFLVGLPGVVDERTAWYKYVPWLVCAFIATVASLLVGTNLTSARSRVATWISKRLYEFLTRGHA